MATLIIVVRMANMRRRMVGFVAVNKYMLNIVSIFRCTHVNILVSNTNIRKVFCFATQTWHLTLCSQWSSRWTYIYLLQAEFVTRFFYHLLFFMNALPFTRSCDTNSSLFSLRVYRLRPSHTLQTSTCTRRTTSIQLYHIRFLIRVYIVIAACVRQVNLRKSAAKIRVLPF